MAQNVHIVPMKLHLTPREVADALGVSESSVKRWADEGALAVSRTAGGHRRLAIEEVIRFARASRLRFAHPELLGLDDLLRLGATRIDATECTDRLFALLRDGAAAEVRGLLLAWFVDGRALSDILDGPVRGAMQRIGDLWQHGPEGVFVEHRASDIVLQALGQLRMLLPAPGPAAPRALGGAPAGDPYVLPSLGAAVLLASQGFAVTNLGPQTPPSALGQAIGIVAPRLVWLSLSSEDAAAALADGFSGILETVERHDAQLVIGGRAAAALAVPDHARLVRVGSMAELDAFARGLAAAVGQDRRTQGAA